LRLRCSCLSILAIFASCALACGGGGGREVRERGERVTRGYEPFALNAPPDTRPCWGGEVKSPSTGGLARLPAYTLPRQNFGGGQFIQKRGYPRSLLLKTTALKGKLTFGDPFLDSGAVTPNVALLLLVHPRNLRLVRLSLSTPNGQIAPKNIW